MPLLKHDLLYILNSSVTASCIWSAVLSLNVPWILMLFLNYTEYNHLEGKRLHYFSTEFNTQRLLLITDAFFWPNKNILECSWLGANIKPSS